jgi:hypothetical protein
MKKTVTSVICDYAGCGKHNAEEQSVSISDIYSATLDICPDHLATLLIKLKNILPANAGESRTVEISAVKNSAPAVVERTEPKAVKASGRAGKEVVSVREPRVGKRGEAKTPRVRGERRNKSGESLVVEPSVVSERAVLDPFKPDSAVKPSAGGSKLSSVEIQDIKVWARSVGIVTPARGRLSAGLVDQYRAAQVNA